MINHGNIKLYDRAVFYGNRRIGSMKYDHPQWKFERWPHATAFENTQAATREELARLLYNQTVEADNTRRALASIVIRNIRNGLAANTEGR